MRSKRKKGRRCYGLAGKMEGTARRGRRLGDAGEDHCCHAVVPPAAAGRGLMAGCCDRAVCPGGSPGPGSFLFLSDAGRLVGAAAPSWSARCDGQSAVIRTQEEEGGYPTGWDRRGGRGPVACDAPAKTAARGAAGANGLSSSAGGDRCLVLFCAYGRGERSGWHRKNGTMKTWSRCGGRAVRESPRRCR